MSKPTRDFDTLVEALAALRAEGYTYDFNLLDDRLHCRDLEADFHPKQFVVDEIFRFEGASNPDDNSILYAIHTEDGTKGSLVDAYGAYSGEISEEMLARLQRG